MPPTGSLKLSPLNLTSKPTGASQTLTVDAFDGSGLPVANVGVALIVDGPNAREIPATTDSTGRATFTYSGVYAGTDTAQAIGRVAGLTTFSNVVNVPWSVGAAPPPDPNQPGGTIGPVVTQGWIGSPLLGTVIQTRTSITVASGVSLVSGILDYWPSSNPAEVKVLNANVVGGGTIATIDPTMLANGEYTIRLRGTLSNGTQQTSLIVISVTGENKPGRVIKTVTDLRIPVAGMPVTISRRYDSLERSKVSDFGYGWSLLTSVRLEVDKKNNVTFNFNGRRQTFVFKPQSGPFPFPFFLFPQWAPEPGTYGTLTADSCGLLILSGGQFTCFLDVPGSFAPTMYHYSDRYGRLFDIGADGQMKSVKDSNGNILSFTPSGIFSSGSGINVPFTRDAQGRIAQITDPAGNHYDYGYDAAGNLTNVHLPSVSSPVQYEYTSDHFLTREIDPRGGSTSATYYADGRLKSQTDRMNFTTQYAYDLNANTVTTTYPDGGVTVRTNNTFGKVISFKDQLNRITTFTYDSNQNVLTRTNQLGKTWTYTYDANGNLTSMKDPVGNIVRKTWDSHGRMLNITDALNQVKQVQYDSGGNVTALTDTIGQLMGATYDSKGNETSLTLPNGQSAQFTYDAFGNVTGLVDHNGFPSTHEYDALGQLKSIKDARHGEIALAFDPLGNYTQRRDPLGNVLTYAYDSNGNRIAETDANGAQFTHDYDGNDRMIRTTYPDGSKVEMAYDFAGRLLTRKSASNAVEQFVWDKAGQLTSVTNAAGTPDAVTTNFTYDPAGRINSITDGRNDVTVFTYDDADRVKAIRDPAGRSTAIAYDANNQVTGVTRADNLTRQSRYDVRGRLTTVINPDGTTFQHSFDGMTLRSVTSEDGRTTSYTHDSLGQIASVTDPAGHLTQYFRDVVGNVTGVRDPNGHVTNYEYDAADRLVKKILPDGGFEQYTYDADGHVTATRLTDGHINRYTWDARDRLVRIDYFDGNVTTFIYTATGKRQTATAASGTTRYDYDTLDRLIRITEPTGVVVSYAYDAEDNITSITTPRGVTRYTYDALDRLRTVTDPTGGVTTYTYDLGGRLAQRQLANGVITDYSYDSLDRLINLVHHLGAAASFASFQYTLSPNGQRISVREVDGTRTSWTYDDAYRLIRENVVNGSGTTIADLAYAYDHGGNRTSMTSNGVTTVYQYDALDQLTSAGSAQYTHDARGNLVRITDSSGVTTYGYDAANRLTAAGLPDGRTASYAYDADGRLTRQNVGGPVRNFAWNELSQFGDIAYESDAAGGSIANYSYAGNELVQRLGASASYYVQDGLGSVVGLTNSAGAQTDTYRDDGFGVRTLSTGTTTNPFGYRGQWSDDATSLLYLRSRWFSPNVGRFLTRDLASFRLNDPIDLNRYAYAAANPINGYDPTGRSDLVEYGAISRESAENATIEGYLVGRRAETLLSCGLVVISAMMVDIMLRSLIGAGEANPVNGRPIWKGLPNVITVAFGWIAWGPTDEPGPDYIYSPANPEGRKVLLWKAGVFRASPRELAWAMSGNRINSIFKFLGDIIGGIAGVFIGNDENLADKCQNHAELKIMRHAGPPSASVLVSVGARRGICDNCQSQLWPRVIEYGGCMGPLGSNARCVPVP